jgi:hypothetical protein
VWWWWKRPRSIGGSAVLSGGYVWTATSQAEIDRHDDGDPALHRVVIEEYPHVMQWLRDRMEVGAPVRALYGRGQQVDMWSYHAVLHPGSKAAGGFVVPGTEVPTS